MFRSKILILWIILLYALAGFSQNEKCKIDKLEGEWYGLYKYETTGGEFLLILKITEISQCNFHGFVYWPEFFNSKSAISGRKNGELLNFRETRLVQGYHQEITGNYYFSTTGKDQLTGYWADANGNTQGKFELKRKAAISKEDFESYQHKIKESQDYYGTATIFDEAVSITGEDIFKKNDLSVYKNPDLKGMILEGEISINNLSMPAKITYNFPYKTRLEMTLQNNTFLKVSNYDSTWEYNPFDDVASVTVNKVENRNDFGDLNLMEAQARKLQKQGYQVEEINHARLDSIDTYRVIMKKDDDHIALFFDKTYFLLKRIEKNDEITLLLNNVGFKGNSIPRLFLAMSPSQKASFKINDIQSNDHINDSLFVFPARLKSKIKINHTNQSKEYNEEGLKKYENQEYDEAIKLYTKAILINGQNEVYYCNRGLAKSSKEDYYGAISDFNKALEINPAYIKALNQKGISIYKLDDFKNAIIEFSKVLDIDSSHVNAIFNRAYSYYYLEEYEKALNDFTKLTVLNSEEGKYFYHRGIMEAILKQYEDAVKSYESAIDLTFDDAVVYNRLGVCYYSLDNYEEALKNFEISIGMDKEDPVKFSNAGDACQQLGNYDQSIAYYSEAITLDPEKSDHYNAQGLNYYYKEDYDVAVQYYDKAITMEKNAAVYYDNRAYAKSGLMDYVGAIDDFTTSINLDSEDSEIFYQRGLLKILINNHHDGCLDLKKASDMGHSGATADIEENCQVIKD